ncbi:translation initiation factor IF-3, mitochondrial-like [Glandiceps talaboti]
MTLCTGITTRVRQGMQLLVRLHSVHYKIVNSRPSSNCSWSSALCSENIRCLQAKSGKPFNISLYDCASKESRAVQFPALNARLFSSSTLACTKSNPPPADTLVDVIYDDSLNERDNSIQQKKKKGKQERVTIQTVGKKIADKILQLIDETGQNLGAIDRAKAVRISEEKDLKIVLIGPHAKPYPVYKLMSGQQLVEERMKLREKEKKKTPPITSKEMKFSGNITTHDLEIKTKWVHEWLRKGHHVKVIIMDKRERFKTTHEHKEQLVQTLLAGMIDEATLNSKPRTIGKDGKDLQCTLRLLSLKEKVQRKKKKSEETKLKESEETN